MMRISASVVMFKGQTVRGINSSLATESHLHTSRACSTHHDQEFGYKEWTLDRGRTGWIAAIASRHCDAFAGPVASSTKLNRR